MIRLQLVYCMHTTAQELSVDYERDDKTTTFALTACIYQEYVHTQDGTSSAMARVDEAPG